MILNATTKYTFPGLPRCGYTGVAWRPIGGAKGAFDNARLVAWLLGTFDAHQHPSPGPESETWLFDTEALRDGGNVQGILDLVRTVRETRPNIKTLLYDPSLRYSPLNPGARETMLAKVERRLADPMEREILSLADAWCPDWYIFGHPVKGCATCGTAGKGAVNNPDVLDEAATLATMPAYLAGQEEIALRIEATGVFVIPTIHERFHPGSGLKADTFMPIELWRAYVRGVKAHRPHAVWWSAQLDKGRRTNGTTIWEWAPAETMKPYGEAAIKAAA